MERLLYEAAPVSGNDGAHARPHGGGGLNATTRGGGADTKPPTAPQSSRGVDVAGETGRCGHLRTAVAQARKDFRSSGFGILRPVLWLFGRDPPKSAPSNLARTRSIRLRCGSG